MERILKMQAGEYYLIESTASANSVYFENDDLAKLFFRYADYYLKDYLKIEEYAINADGWMMLIKVKSAKTVRRHYTVVAKDRTNNDKEASSEPMYIWRILSERIRLFISTYVRMSNKILGRTGSLIRRKYSRYKFDSLHEAQNYIAKIRNEVHTLHQTNEKYRGIDNHFQMSGTNLTNPLRSSLWLELKESKAQIENALREIFGVDMPILHGIGDLVVQELKFKKCVAKFTTPKPPKP